MSCRRAFDVDLVACLLDRARPEWQAFRDHYPTCIDCAAEVRTWTELHGELAPAHPDPATLVRYEDAPATLTADERTRLAEHVAACPACRDEVRALRVTDVGALVRAGSSVARSSGTSVPIPRPVRARRGVGRRIRGFLWSPGFAYAVAIALLIPALAPDRTPWSPPAVFEDRSANVAAFEAAPTEQASERRADVGGAALADVASEERKVAARQREADAVPATASPPSPDAAATVVWPRLNMTPDTGHLVIAASPGLILTLPMPGDGVTAGPASLRIRDTAGRRELREEYFGAPTRHVALRVPSDWLRPGHYVVELLTGGDTAVARATLEVAQRPEAMSR